VNIIMMKKNELGRNLICELSLTSFLLVLPPTLKGVSSGSTYGVRLTGLWSIYGSVTGYLLPLFFLFFF
jgi:uncharacterized membrane protein YdjX (TVP38/TMEM64 family)